jgi:DNA-binding MarR family transcriptional regulator
MATIDEFSAEWERFFQVVRRRRARHLGPLASGLTIGQYLLLEPLIGGRARSVSELADAGGVAPPTASRLLDGLAQQGIVARAPNSDDRRRTDVTLTPDGQERLAAHRREVQRFRRRLYDALDEDDRAHAQRLFGRLADILDEL